MTDGHAMTWKLSEDEFAHEETFDRGHRKYRSELFVKGAEVFTVKDAYYGAPIPMESFGRIESVTNAGFRGIEASVILDDGRRAILSLDVLGLVYDETC